MDIKLENVFFSYKNEKKPILKNINISFPEGKVTALLGPSGSGKSTLLKLLNGLYKPDSGRVLASSFDIWDKSYSRKKLREKVGLVFQYPEDQLFSQTVLEDVAFGPMNQGHSKEESIEEAKRALALLDVSSTKWDKSPLALSGGEKRRVALSGVIAMRPDVLVLDEMVSGLDGKAKESLFELLRKLNSDGVTIIYTSHSVEDVASFSDKCILLENGEVKVEGVLSDIYSYDNRYLTEGAKLKERLVSLGYNLSSDMSSIESATDSLFSLFSS